MLGCIVNLKPIGKTTCLSGFECVIQGGQFVCIQIIHDQNNLLLGKMNIGEVFQHMGKVRLSSTVSDFHMTLSQQWSRQHEEICRSVPCIFVIVARGLVRTHGSRETGFQCLLPWGLIQADQNRVIVILAMVHFQNIFHSIDKISIRFGGNTPSLLTPRL